MVQVADGDDRIERLPELIGALPPEARAAAERLFAVSRTEGEVVPPPDMVPWVERTFGSVAAVRHQRIVRVTNRWTFEGAVFNPLRARRPGAGGSSDEGALAPELRARIEGALGDDFCDPEHRTPAESIGRIRGRHVVTAANVAKMDGWHTLLIFDRHDPLRIDRDLLSDLLDVAQTWIARVRERDAGACHCFLCWNCLWRAGASQVHGHAQLLLSHEMPQSKVALWAQAMQRYRVETGSGYFADLIGVHQALGLAGRDGAGVWLASLTPIRDCGIDILLPAVGDPGMLPLRSLAVPLARLLETMRMQMGVTAFNLAIFGPPLGGNPAWEGFPLVARFVARGDPLATAADVAAMELFGSWVIASDPFAVARALAHS
jgi:hypothetical protein